MSVAIVILLLAAAAAALLTSIGVLAARDVYQRLHYLAPAGTVGVVAVAAAIVVREGLHQAGIKAVIAAAVLLVANPVLTHATARAARVQERGRWEEDEQP